MLRPRRWCGHRSKGRDDGSNRVGQGLCACFGIRVRKSARKTRAKRRRDACSASANDHMRTVASSAPVTKARPSGPNRTQCTFPWCPRMMALGGLPPAPPSAAQVWLRIG